MNFGAAVWTFRPQNLVEPCFEQLHIYHRTAPSHGPVRLQRKVVRYRYNAMPYLTNLKIPCNGTNERWGTQRAVRFIPYRGRWGI